MEHPTPQYDLLPLLWWENPWILGSLCGAIALALALTYYLWRSKYTQPIKPLSPLEQWLIDLKVIQHEIQSQEFIPPHVYHVILRVIRAYAHVYHDLHSASYTDEEFMEALKKTSTPVPEAFIEVVHTITLDVYQVKFANTLFPINHVANHLTTLVHFLEQQRERKENSPSQ